MAARVPLEKATKGAPYSAETLVESSQSLADGNRISSKTTGRVYRDGEGRTRREEERQERVPVTSRSTIPSAGIRYSLDPESKIAWRTPTGVAGAIMDKLEAAQVEASKRVYEERIDSRMAARSGGQVGAADFGRQTEDRDGRGRQGGARRRCR